MTDFLTHADIGNELTKSEFEGTTLHVLQNGAAGDLLVGDSAGNVARLAAGGASQFLGISGGVPAWANLSSIDHDALTNFVANEHINWVAGAGATANFQTSGSIAGGAISGTTGTFADDLTVKGADGQAGKIYLYADRGDDNADKWLFNAADGGALTIQSYAGGSWATKWTLTNAGALSVGAISGTTGNFVVSDVASISAHANADNLVIEQTGAAVGMSILGDYNQSAYIMFGDSGGGGDNDRQYIRSYKNDATGGILAFATNTVERHIMYANGNFYMQGDLTVNGNDINSSTATAISLSGANVEAKGTLTANGLISTTGNLKIKTIVGGAGPTTTDIPAGECAFWNDTSVGQLFFYYNLGGSLKAVQLA